MIISNFTILTLFIVISNVTGVITSTNEVSALIHRSGGLAFYDYATAAPYVKV